MPENAVIGPPCLYLFIILLVMCDTEEHITKGIVVVVTDVVVS